MGVRQAADLARAARYNRQQTPAKIVRQLEARAPVVFSFPEQHDVSFLRDPVDLGYELAGAAVVGVLLPLGEWRPLVRDRLWWGATEVAGVAAGDRSRKRSFGPDAELGVAVPVW